MSNIKLKILDKRLGNEFGFPKYATSGSAGIDLVACLQEPLTLSPGACELIPSGIAIHIDNPELAAVIKQFMVRKNLGVEGSRTRPASYWLDRFATSGWKAGVVQGFPP